MKLTDLLVRDACVMDAQARTKGEALRELAHAMAEATPQLDESTLLEQLLERERLGTTAMGDGIAIPHARVESLDRLHIGFSRSRHGVEFESLDGKPTHLFFLLVAPGREGSAHLLALARLSRLLTVDVFRERLNELVTVDELVAAFAEAEADR